ncbi:hypothetical protein [Microbacterium lacus]|uniref:hypothetical protein n=1 Tax=Microbacterium lacus TaxID=415217 RepID=UPI000C2CBE88|nr:hypothetical protein [Microbacterium lacus]
MAVEYRPATLADMVAAADAVNDARDALTAALWLEDDGAHRRARRALTRAQRARDAVHYLGVPVEVDAVPAVQL